MHKQTVIFLHGFASSRKTSKARYLTEKFAGVPEVEFQAFDFNPTPRDFEHLTVTGMINRLRQYVLDQGLRDLRLIGSSLGALVGIHYTLWFGEVERMLLLAPALLYAGIGEPDQKRWQETGTVMLEHFGFGEALPLRYGLYEDGMSYSSPVPPPAPMMILHGARDEVAPIEGSRAYAAAYPEMVKLVELDSDHRLEDQLEALWGYVNSFLLGG